MSSYRERKASKSEFYTAFEDTLVEYNLLESDTCVWMDSLTSFGNTRRARKDAWLTWVRALSALMTVKKRNSTVRGVTKTCLSEHMAEVK
jgi:hypothetical protein